MADQEFLASFGVAIDESGLIRLQSALRENRELAEELADAFDRARSTVQAFFRELGEMPLPSLSLGSARVTEQTQGINLPLSLDFTKAGKELSAFLKEAQKTFRLSADGSAIVTAGQNALNQLRRMFAAAILPLKIQIEVPNVPEIPVTIGTPASGIPGMPSSTAGDSGVEPSVSGPARAVTPPSGQPGAQSLQSVLSSVLNVSNVTAPVTNNNSKNVSAPVSINVTAAGASPEAVGQSVYDVAERYLLRTLSGSNE